MAPCQTNDNLCSNNLLKVCNCPPKHQVCLKTQLNTLIDEDDSLVIKTDNNNIDKILCGRCNEYIYFNRNFKRKLASPLHFILKFVHFLCSLAFIILTVYLLVNFLTKQTQQYYLLQAMFLTLISYPTFAFNMSYSCSINKLKILQNDSIILTLLIPLSFLLFFVPSLIYFGFIFIICKEIQELYKSVTNVFPVNYQKQFHILKENTVACECYDEILQVLHRRQPNIQKIKQNDYFLYSCDKCHKYIGFHTQFMPTFKSQQLFTILRSILIELTMIVLLFFILMCIGFGRYYLSLILNCSFGLYFIYVYFGKARKDYFYDEVGAL